MQSEWLQKHLPALWVCSTAKVHWKEEKDADIIALDRDLNVRAVWAMGKLVEGTNKTFFNDLNNSTIMLISKS